MARVYLAFRREARTGASNAAVSAALPRTWRVVWTLGGTTPSFTITNIQVAYQV